ncbi:MAG TPA: metal-dependent hydrolase [Thermoplasmata archaeon]|nr:metal-dependent hydrolase [Thermoplasmata archaeon]
MFLLGHLGIGLGLAWLLSWKSATRIEYRLVLFGAILPDLIDKPLAYVTGLDSRIWAHTFLFLFAILALSLVPTLRGFRLVGFGVATHLLLDQIWNQPAIVWYPAYGWSFPMAPFDAGRWFDTLLHDPYVQAGEIVGLAVLITFAWVHGIGSWKTLREFVVHGVLPWTEREANLRQG